MLALHWVHKSLRHSTLRLRPFGALSEAYGATALYLKTGQLYRETGDLSRKTDDLYRETVDLYHETNDLSRKTGQLYRETDDLSRKTDGPSRKTGDLYHETGEPYHETGRSRCIGKRLRCILNRVLCMRKRNTRLDISCCALTTYAVWYKISTTGYVASSLFFHRSDRAQRKTPGGKPGVCPWREWVYSGITFLASVALTGRQAESLLVMRSGRGATVVAGVLARC